MDFKTERPGGLDSSLSCYNFKDLVTHIQPGNPKYSEFMRYNEYGTRCRISGITLMTAKDSNYKPIGVRAEIVGYDEIAPLSGEGIVLAVASDANVPAKYRIDSREGFNLQKGAANLQMSEKFWIVPTYVVLKLHELRIIEMKVIVDEIQKEIDALIGPNVFPDQEGIQRLIKGLRESPRLEALFKFETTDEETQGDEE